MKTISRVTAVLFFLSGFCSLVYQLIWVRLAYSHFGIMTSVLSVALSTFMLGLALGSWLAGTYVGPWHRRTRMPVIYLYALAECLIGLGAFAVPRLFALGEQGLMGAGEMNSFHFLAWSAAILSLSIIPWCICMGATFPLMMAFYKEKGYPDSTSFSFLYGANVLGALSGTAATALFMVELLGFRQTLALAAGLNGLIALISIALGLHTRHWQGASTLQGSETPRAGDRESGPPPSFVYTVLFATGLTAMSLEVVWTRAFTIVLKTSVYSFAWILSVYLFATWVGVTLCRRRRISNAYVFASLSLSAFLPIVMNDPRLPAHPLLIAISLFPLCAILGYLTPHLIDQLSQGAPRGAGRAYALNTLGCIMGPLLTSYVLLPAMGVRTAMIVMSIPFVLLHAISIHKLPRPAALAFGSGTILLLLCSTFRSISYEEGFLLHYPHPVFRRDPAATVVCAGRGLKKQLFINGIPTTNQTLTTKVMAHLPLAYLETPPTSALAICFGMGTTYRSLLSWNIRTTAVELVPSVKASFGYFHDDADPLLKSALGEIVIDDGRRFMNRTSRIFDVITIDPPPPVEAAGSSLLYSTEFYGVAKRRLSPKGILLQWIPAAEPRIVEAVRRSLELSFPYVITFQSAGGGTGHLFLASMSPLKTPTVNQFVDRLPPRAKQDLLEWSEMKDLHALVATLLAQRLEMRTDRIPDPDLFIRDDRPYNEYFLLRRWLAKT